MSEYCCNCGCELDEQAEYCLDCSQNNDLPQNQNTIQDASHPVIVPTLVRQGSKIIGVGEDGLLHLEVTNPFPSSVFFVLKLSFLSSSQRESFQEFQDEIGGDVPASSSKIFSFSYRANRVGEFVFNITLDAHFQIPTPTVRCYQNCSNSLALKIIKRQEGAQIVQNINIDGDNYGGDIKPNIIIESLDDAQESGSEFEDLPLWKIVDSTPGEKTGYARKLQDPQTGMIFILVEPGEFTMGEATGDRDETPHVVSLTEPYWLSETQVTQEVWEKIMGSNPSYFKGEQLPVESISWNDCQDFLAKLGTNYRLPSEAQWEYACRAGTTTKYYAGELEQCLDSIAWYDKNAGGETHKVGLKQPNAWGFYDMHGNVWEWCRDWYGRNYYTNSPATNPTGPASGSRRVFRGGSWFPSAFGLRCASRNYGYPTYRGYDVGFRVLAVH